MNSTPITESLIHGAAEVEPGERGLRLHRLPDWARRQFPDAQLLAMEAQPSGVRLVVRTAATSVELTTHPSRVAYRGADRPRGRIDVLVDGALHLRDELNGGDRLEVDLQTGDTVFHPGPAHITRVSGLPAGEKRVEFWLPHNETLELLTLRSDAPLVADASPARVWMHHGSSISHGSNATAPTEIWPAVAALRAGVSLRNLGLGGSALADPFLARVMRDTPADLISVKLGINLVNLDVMRLRAFVPAIHGFLDTIRDGHPDTALLLISPIFCGIHEKTPGPGAFDPASFGTGQMRFIATGDADDATRLTLERIRRELHTVMERRADDPHLHFLEGTALYGEVDAVQHPLPDGLHPDSATHQMIGERFVEQVFAAGGAFAPAV